LENKGLLKLHTVIGWLKIIGLHNYSKIGKFLSNEKLHQGDIPLYNRFEGINPASERIENITF